MAEAAVEAEAEAPAETDAGLEAALWPDPEGEAAPGSARPRLTLVRGGGSGTSVIWRKADEQAVWWRNPLWLMGALLGLMVLLIVLW